LGFVITISFGFRHMRWLKDQLILTMRVHERLFWMIVNMCCCYTILYRDSDWMYVGFANTFNSLYAIAISMQFWAINLSKILKKLSNEAYLTKGLNGLW